MNKLEAVLWIVAILVGEILKWYGAARIVKLLRWYV